MRHLPETILLLCLFLPGIAVAQHWTADEQSLIDAINHCWSSLDEETRTYDIFQNRCRWTDETTSWYLPDTAPEVIGSGWREGLINTLKGAPVSQDLRPLRIRIEDNFGFIWLHGIRLWEYSDGSRQTESFRSFEVWKETPDGWSFFGGMGAPDVGAGNAILESRN